MSAEGLGEDIEEIWMGHKVSGNAAKLYNHRDKQGRNRMTKKRDRFFRYWTLYLQGEGAALEPQALTAAGSATHRDTTQRERKKKRRRNGQSVFL
jgi:hypothetical protein